MSDNNESFLDYKKRLLDSISPTFCSAKWLNSTIWLGSGTTASCHLPPAHRISVEELKNNPSAIHNTFHKKVMRAQMLNGQRPAECEYCWKIEDLGKDHLSDRVFKSRAFKDEDTIKASKLKANANINPKTLEIAFDRTCNFACSYCNASFSTRWGQDIKQNGVYKSMRSDGGGAYRHDGSWAEPFNNKDENPYIKAFWEWWPDLSQSLEELRLTGGEPLLSKETWKLLEKFKDNEYSNLRLAINSNLGVPEKLIEEFIRASKNVSNLDIYTSCESTHQHAEYIRDGLNYKQYLLNIENIMKNAKYNSLHMMVTVNSLCLFSLTDFLNQIIEWKKIYANKAPHFILNILRFPSFMSPTVLPSEVKAKLHKSLLYWYEENKNNPLLSSAELGTFHRVVDYVDQVKTPHHKASEMQILEQDFKNFYSQYDTRRKKDFASTFPDLKDWFNAISPDPFVYPGEDYVDGDSTKGWHDYNKIMQTAKELKLKK